MIKQVKNALWNNREVIKNRRYVVEDKNVMRTLENNEKQNSTLENILRKQKNIRKQ